MKRTLFAALLAMTALPAHALDLSAMTEAEKAAFGQAVKDYLMENPQVLVEAINKLEERQAAAEAQNDKQLVATNAKEIFEDGHSWVGGNPEGDVTIVEFMDNRCSYCKKANTEVDQLLKKDGKIRFVVKEFPILGPQSELAARFAVAVQQVAGDALPAAVGEALGCLARASLVEQALALLIGAQPEIAQLEGVGRSGLHEQQGETEQPAATGCTGGNQQQR